MHNDTLRLVGRLLLSFSFIGLVLTGHVAGGVGVTAATITGGLDFPAALQAYSEIRSDDQAESEQTKF